MLKGFENIEKESLFDVISSKREDMENKWKRRKNLYNVFYFFLSFYLFIFQPRFSLSILGLV
jgi:hypothetical protein